MSKHTLSVLVEDKPGVLARIASLFARRGFNIDSLAVGPTEHPEISRMTVVVDVEALPLEQVTKQLNKLVDVIRVNDLTAVGHLERELVLVEVAAPKGKRSEIMELAALFKAEIIGVRENSLTIQFVGTRNLVEDFLKLLRPYTIMDLARSGLIAVARGE